MNLINIDEPTKQSDANICLGIDFGTTNSVCSIFIDNQFKYIVDSFGKKLIPTLILYESKNKFFGNETLEKKNFLKSIFSIKRNFIGDFDEIKYEDNEKNKVSSIDVSKDFFIYLKEQSEKFLNKKVFDCVITVPAYFDEKVRSGIMRAAFMAGFRVRRLINPRTARMWRSRRANSQMWSRASRRVRLISTLPGWRISSKPASRMTPPTRRSERLPSTGSRAG